MEESRRLLESHLNEFFATTTSNDRKRQIEVVLENFSKQNGSWKQALYFLSHSSSNQYVTMFCLSVIETTIKCKWLMMSGGEKDELKTTIYSFLLQHSMPSSASKCPGFVRNKIIKLLVDVGKFSWPQSYPDFFSNILAITANEETVGIGLSFIKTISEEYPNCKDEISTDRKMELKALLLQQMPEVFERLKQILMSGLERYVCASREAAGGSQNHENAVVTHFDEVLSLTLETTSNLFTWIPLDGYKFREVGQNEKAVPFQHDFIKLICQYAYIDTCPYFSTKGSQLGILAMGALNELLYRKFIPKEFDFHISAVTSFAVDLLKRVESRSTIMSLPQQYLEKVIEFMCLVASHHFFRYDGPCSKQFITSLLSFTFEQSETVYYYECLEVWARLLDHLNAGVPFVNITLNRDDLIECFKQPMLDLATKIVLSTQKFEIETDDTFETDEEEEDTEAPNLSRNIDILVKIGELLPKESLEVVNSLWAESCVYYGGLASFLDPMKTTITIENDTNIKHFIFIIQLVGRLANVFYGHFERLYGDVFKKQIEVGKSILHELIKVLLCSKEYYFVKFPSSIVQANCEIICSLKTWVYWLARYHSEFIQTDAPEPDVQSFYEMVNVCTEFVFFTLENRTMIDHSIVLAQANFFNTLVNTLRTQHIFKMQCARSLIEKLHTLGGSLDTETFRVLHKVSAALILLPWQNVSNQDWDVRSKLYMEFMKNMSNDLFESASRTTALAFWVHVLNDQLDMLMSECTNSKRICWNVYKELVPFMRNMATQHIKEPIVLPEILTFFTTVMEVLRQQVGTQFFEETIKLFLLLFSRGNIVHELMKESDNIVVEKFLSLLTFMIKDGSSSFKKFLGEALTLCYSNIYPHLAQRPTPDLKIPFFQLIRDCVNYRWNYFFPSNLTARNAVLSSGLSVQSPEQAAESNFKLSQILQSIGHSFLQPDLEIFRFNLATLSSWNEKHKFYSRLSDRQEYMDQFMTLFFQILIQKSHDLLREEIATVLFEMASVNYDRFCKDFLPQTVSMNFPQLTMEYRVILVDKFSTQRNQENCNTHSSASTLACDLPTFTQNLNKFIDDIRYYHFCIECSSAQVQPNVAIVKPMMAQR
ncbi:Exportin-6 [Orchesella cincta]|uniref:Exportin-6 n=1 Tax=Orchesella cincta TaxID=48709 RepID=A0A1D2N362_ORCCI|nr:Exportin-6 [Orchesella cincta]